MELIFSTFNARYSHTALALRCLRANLGELHDRSALLEFDNSLSPQVAADRLLEHNPRTVLFSVYIWNLTVTAETVALLRARRPDLRIVIGGPEVSYEFEELALFRAADHLLRGEGEALIETLCRALLAGAPLPKVIDAPLADLTRVALPYGEYTPEDIAHRRIYVETARGCPFHCEYCLSALDSTVRFVPPARIFPEFERLLERGVRIFKFLDRSFNISAAHAAAILRFFLARQCEGLMLHLEWEPAHLPPSLETLLAAFPPSSLQLEIGIQTFNPEVAQRIARPLNIQIVETNLRKLAALPAVHLHADLIAGLPGESFESLADGFDQLHACGPDEIQLGLLKKLRGAPIARHDTAWQMVYNSSPPYDVLQTSALSFIELQRIRRFARYWDITVNNGRFPHTAQKIWEKNPSVFAAFMEWSDWLYEQTHATWGFSPEKLAWYLEAFLTGRRGLPAATVRSALEQDLCPCATASAKGRERQYRAAVRRG